MKDDNLKLGAQGKGKHQGKGKGKYQGKGKGKGKTINYFLSSICNVTYILIYIGVARLALYLKVQTTTVIYSHARTSSK